MRSLIIFCTILNFIDTQVNLYIPIPELEKLLGFDAELFYVRNGHENSDAIQHELLLAEHVQTVKFQWEDTRPRQTSHLPTLYNMKTTKQKAEVVELVSLTIPDWGEVPREEEAAFELVIACEDSVKDSSLIFLEINFTNAVSPDQKKAEDLNFMLRFKKLCDPDVNLKQPDESFYERRNEPSEVEDENGDTSLFYVFVSIGVALFIMAASTIGFLHAKSIPSSQEVDEPLLPSEPVNEEATQKAISKVLKAAAAEKQYKELISSLREFAIRRTLLSVANTVQEGSFGRAYVGSIISPESGEEIKVLIKTVTEQASIEQKSIFLAEAVFLKRMVHHNVLSVMHLCGEDESKPPMVIYPYMNRGNLKNYLRLSRTVETLAKPLTTRDIVLMALQIAKGLQYLGRRRIIHTDVATRNCVVDDELHVKLCDNALSRDFFPGDYYCLGENENRPVRWMAVESLESNVYLHSSDVWSYGVLLWELMSLAQTPYSNVDPLEMLKYLKSGLRLPQPANCPDDFFTVMACSWALSPEERPQCTQIIACLEAFLNTLNAFI